MYTSLVIEYVYSLVISNLFRTVYVLFFYYSFKISISFSTLQTGFLCMFYELLYKQTF